MKNLFKKIIVFLLQLEAKLVLKKYRPKIVGITGSVGKTSTKDAIYSVMSTSFFVRKSVKSFNSEIGIPLTILGLPNAWNNPLAWIQNLFDGLILIIFPHKYPDWLVLEVGADRPGDIESVAFWLKPDVAVVTRLSEVPVHVEFFASAEQVRHEKAQLVHGTGKDSVVILNADDRLVSTLRSFAKGKVLTYGTNKGADISATNYGFISDAGAGRFPTGIFFETEIAGSGQNSSVKIEIEGVLGRQQMYSALAALALGHALKIDPEKTREALRVHNSPPGRMNILSGAKDTCIIDDTYNSSPVAATEALLTLKEIKVGGGVAVAGRKIAVLGDMLELGTHSLVEHQKLGRAAAEFANEIYTVGPRAKATFEAAKEAGFPESHLFWFADSAEAGQVLRGNLQAGDVVLVKGSQGIRMEKAVALIMADPAQAGKLLVRQESEWWDR